MNNREGSLISDVRDMDNYMFLFDALANAQEFAWSDIHPYYAYINGHKKYFDNSYIAHIEKHPKNKEEAYIWEKVLPNYPHNLETTYLSYSNKLIFANKESLAYDEKNHSINITNKDNIRASIKRSSSNNAKTVIVTCHPRSNKKDYQKYFNENKYEDAINYFTKSNIAIYPHNESLKNLLLPSDSHEFNESNKELKLLIESYLIDICEEINKLEYYKEKCHLFEETDAFDYDEIIEHIDKLFLCYKYYNSVHSCDNELYKKLLDRYKNIDEFKNISKYISDLEYLHGLPSHNEMYHFVTSRLVPIKEDFLNCLDDICKEENITIKPKEVADFINPTKLGHARNLLYPDNLTTPEIFALCKFYKVSMRNTKLLLSTMGYAIPIKYAKEIYDNWTEVYSNDKICEYQEKLANYLKKS